MAHSGNGWRIEWALMVTVNERQLVIDEDAWTSESFREAIDALREEIQSRIDRETEEEG